MASYEPALSNGRSSGSWSGARSVLSNWRPWPAIAIWAASEDAVLNELVHGHRKKKQARRARCVRLL